MRTLMEFDPEVARAIELEKEGLANKLELIASENFVTYVVMEAMGTVLTNSMRNLKPRLIPKRHTDRPEPPKIQACQL